jgi:hypothetical protein
MTETAGIEPAAYERLKARADVVPLDSAAELLQLSYSGAYHYIRSGAVEPASRQPICVDLMELALHHVKDGRARAPVAAGTYNCDAIAFRRSLIKRLYLVFSLEQIAEGLTRHSVELSDGASWAHVLEVSPATVLNDLNALGLARRQRGTSSALRARRAETLHAAGHLTSADVAALVPCSRVTVERRARNGDITSTRVGREYIFDASAVELLRRLIDEGERNRAESLARARASGTRPRRGLVIECERCGRGKYVPPSHADQRFCSMSCRSAWTFDRGVGQAVELARFFGARARQKWRGRWGGAKGGRKRGYTEDQARRVHELKVGHPDWGYRTLAAAVGLSVKQVRAILSKG